jgi:membrane protein YqaA with SNARE-associated domain
MASDLQDVDSADSAGSADSAAGGPRKLPTSRLARLHATLRRWADAGWSGSVVLGWGLLQGCILPGFVDLFFLPLAVARPSRAYHLALISSAGTITGSVVLYLLGARALGWLEGPVAGLFDLSQARFDSVRATLAQWGAWAIFASTMTPLSTKLTSIASGAVGVPFLKFVIALSVGRLTRTLGLAYLVRHGGAQAVERWMAR